MLNDVLTQVALDPGEIRRRNEEEFQKRLKGEYEAAQRRVGQVVRLTFNL